MSDDDKTPIDTEVKLVGAAKIPLRGSQPKNTVPVEDTLDELPADVRARAEAALRNRGGAKADI